MITYRKIGKFNPQAELKPDKAPKPVDRPVSEPEDLSDKRHRADQPVDVIPSQDIALDRPDKPRVPSILKVPVGEPEVPADDQNFLNINFYQAPLRIPYHEDFKVNLPSGIDQLTIAQYWEEMSKKNYLSFLQSVIQRRIQMQLNDWAYYRLLYTLGQEISGGNPLESRLFTWFMLLQSGYKARVGYADNQVYLLLPTHSTVYEKTYYRFDGINYYVMDAPTKPPALNIYDRDYPDAQNLLYLEVVKDFKISPTSSIVI
ncbi:MAG: hypothetical protein HC880_08895 [Bacteroidia bacterium]|nr:hypothetical protein [Bacteroidia bacterium]